MIFDVKLGENFRRKARMVDGGHTKMSPLSLIYLSVISRDSVRIALTIASLNDLEVMACDIQNAYLTAQCSEKIWTTAGPEFVSESGQTMIIVRALYGLKSSGAAFRALLAETLHDLGYTPLLADQDVWLRPEVKENGFEYYEVILCYVDNVLSISHDLMKTMNGIRANFILKYDKVEKPDIYLGALLEKMATADGVECWTMSPEKYCKAAVENVENTLNDHGRKFSTNCRAPLKSCYRI